MAIVGLKLGVQVLVQVDLVRERMNTVTIVSVVVDQLHGDLVEAYLQHVAVQDNLAITEVAADGERRDWLIINDQISDIGSKEVEENGFLVGTWHLGEIERDGCLAKVLCTLR